MILKNEIRWEYDKTYLSSSVPNLQFDFGAVDCQYFVLKEFKI